MIKTVVGLSALGVFLACAAQADPSDALSQLRACRSLPDSERLSCFDRALAAQDVAKPKAMPSQGAVQAAVPAEFGGERLAPSAEQPAEFIIAKVASARINALKQFTVELDNGQVWRQLESDTVYTRLRGAETVKISRGFLGSYSLTVEGAWGTYKVKRIK